MKVNFRILTGMVLGLGLMGCGQAASSVKEDEVAAQYTVTARAGDRGYDTRTWKKDDVFSETQNGETYLVRRVTRSPMESDMVYGPYATPPTSQDNLQVYKYLSATVSIDVRGTNTDEIENNTCNRGIPLAGAGTQSDGPRDHSTFCSRYKLPVSFQIPCGVKLMGGPADKNRAVLAERQFSDCPRGINDIVLRPDKEFSAEQLVNVEAVFWVEPKNYPGLNQKACPQCVTDNPVWVLHKKTYLSFTQLAQK